MDYQEKSKKAKAEGDAEAEEPKKEVKKVVSGNAVVKKPSLGTKFKNVFFGGDFKASMTYVTADIVLPAARNMVADAFKGAVDRVIYGETRTRSRMPDYRPRYNYQNPLSRVMVDPRLAPNGHLPDQPPIMRNMSSRTSSEIILPSREDAQNVLEGLDDIISQYDQASLADLYELCGLPSEHTDNKRGWTYVKNAEIAQVRDGYLVRLPPMVDL